MGRRFGRNQKRRMRADVEAAQQAQRTAEKRAENARDRELYAKRELDEVRHGLDFLVRAVDAQFPELLAFNGREVRHVEWVHSGMLRISLHDKVSPTDTFARVSDPHFARTVTKRDIDLVKFYSIIERDEVRLYLGTLIHFFADSPHGRGRASYCMSEDMLRQNLAPHAIQELTLAAAREALGLCYTEAAKAYGARR